MIRTLTKPFAIPAIPDHAKERMNRGFIAADRVMIFLLCVQWFIASFVTSLTYGSYLLGFVGGGFITLTVLLSYRLFKGTRTLRAIIATAMMLFSLIYIQQHLGRLEMHFHIFIAMALLTLYKDVFPILIAATVTIAHHLVFNYLQLYGIHLFDTPIIVFNYGCGLDIVLLHGAFVVFEALALIYIVKLQLEQHLQTIESERTISSLHDQLQEENRRNLELAQKALQFVNALDESAIVSKADTTGKITYINKKFCDVSGYSSDELIGKPHNIIRHEDMPKELFKEMWETIKAKKIFKGIIKNRKKNGNAYYVESVIIPLLDIEGNIIEYLAVRYDVTELIEARDRAMQAQKAKDQFLANMSHELRTPLNAIIGFTQLLQKKVEDKGVVRYLDIIKESSDSLLHLINDILDLAKMQSGKFSLHPSPFHLENSLKQLYGRFKQQADEKTISYAIQIDKSIADHYIGDWVRISQIISNFISNAIKFTPKEGSVTITARYCEGKLYLNVSDTGIGLNEEAKQRIFNPFEQADSSTTRKYGGTGLGLSISKELVGMMDGRIEIESSEGNGSTFTLILPLEQQHVIQKEDAGETTAMPAKLQGHLLVAEDNKSNQMLIKLLLEEMGLTCDIAQNGEEAVTMYNKKAYDLVLMDENMPVMGGTEAMQNIRASHEETAPIIVLTANVMQGDRERFLEAGMDDYLSKPIDDKELQSVLKKYLLKS